MQTKAAESTGAEVQRRGAQVLEVGDMGGSGGGGFEDHGRVGQRREAMGQGNAGGFGTGMETLAMWRGNRVGGRLRRPTLARSPLRPPDTTSRG